MKANRRMGYVMAIAVVAFVGGSLAYQAQAADAVPASGTPSAAPAPQVKTEGKYTKKEIDRFWVTAEALLMWSKDGPVHDVYVTRAGTPASNFTMTSPGVQFLFKQNKQDYGLQPGGRLTFGAWVDDAREWGVQLSGFALTEGTDRFHYTQTGTTGAGVPLLLTFPVGAPFEWQYGFHFGFQPNPGSISIESSSQLWGIEGLGLKNLIRSDDTCLDLTFGVKHLDLSEDFTVKAYENGLGGPFNEVSHIKDEFKAHNQFFGGKVGIKFHLTAFERLLVDVEPGVSLGATREHLDVSGHFVGSYGLSPNVGGIYTAKTNIGDQTKAKFAVVPEIKIGLGCKILHNFSFNANYNFMYLSSVVRPGEQVTRTVNRANIPAIGGGGVLAPTAPFDPAKRFKTSDYWAHGVGAGFTVKF